MQQVPFNEGVTNRIGIEPGAQASARVLLRSIGRDRPRTGQSIKPVEYSSPGVDAVVKAEGNTAERLAMSARASGGTLTCSAGAPLTVTKNKE